MERLFILNKQQCNDKEFVIFWSKLYYYKLKDKYNSRIKKEEYTPEDLIELFEWKNGRKLSYPKANGFLKYVIEKIVIINQLKKNFCDNIFEKEFGERGESAPIWLIFLKHIIQPDKFPIFDQHTYRSFNYLSTGKISEIHSKDRLKIYSEEYLPFFNKIQFEDKKKIDEALFAFGQFLSKYQRWF